MTIKSLNLQLIKPISSIVKVTLQESIEILVGIVVKNIDTFFVSIDYDHNFLKMTRGNALITLTGGTFVKQLSWVLKAIKISPNPLWVESIAETKGLFQAVGFNILINNYRR
ncbi:MAG: hypothetical protein ABIF11_00375 [Nitrospirota bacterium]